MSETERGCPCLYVDPCQPNCTCRNRLMSHGCLRCCSYGSLEQRTACAERLVQEEARLAAVEKLIERWRARGEQSLPDGERWAQWHNAAKELEQALKGDRDDPKQKVVG